MHKHYIHTLLYIHMQPLGGIYPCSQFPAKGLMIQLVTESTHKGPPPPTTHLCRCPSFLRACACILASHSPALLLNTAHSTGHVKWLWKIGNRLPSLFFYLFFTCFLLFFAFWFSLQSFLCFFFLPFFFIFFIFISSFLSPLLPLSFLIFPFLSLFLHLLFSPPLSPCTPLSPLLLWQDNLSHAEAVRHPPQQTKNRSNPPLQPMGPLSILQTNALLEVADTHTNICLIIVESKKKVQTLVLHGESLLCVFQ